MRAWWSGDLTTLLAAPTEAIVQRLAVRLVETHHLNHAAQLEAWREQVDLLHAVAHGLPGNWRVLLEYPLLRLGKRIDAHAADRPGHPGSGVQDRGPDPPGTRAGRGLRTRSARLPRRKPRPSRGADPDNDAGPAARDQLAAAVARRHAGAGRDRTHAGRTGARCRGTHSCPGTTARYRGLGSRAVPAGADHRRGRHHAVSPAQRCRNHRRTRRRRQPDTHQ